MAEHSEERRWGTSWCTLVPAPARKKKKIKKAKEPEEEPMEVANAGPPKRRRGSFEKKKNVKSLEKKMET